MFAILSRAMHGDVATASAITATAGVPHFGRSLFANGTALRCAAASRQRAYNRALKAVARKRIGVILRSRGTALPTRSWWPPRLSEILVLALDEIWGATPSTTYQQGLQIGQAQVCIQVLVGKDIEDYGDLGPGCLKPFAYRVNGDLRSLLLRKAEHARADAAEGYGG